MKEKGHDMEKVISSYKNAIAKLIHQIQENPNSSIYDHFGTLPLAWKVEPSGNMGPVSSEMAAWMAQLPKQKK